MPDKPCSNCGSTDVYRRWHQGTEATVCQCRNCLAGWLESVSENDGEPS